MFFSFLLKSKQICGRSLCYTARSDPSSALRTSGGGMPFDKLKAPGKAGRHSLPALPSVGTGAGRQGLILSGAFYPDSKIGVWRPRTYQ
jgi:hypothetical protein